MLDLNLIRSFVAVSETGSVTEAAERLRQPKSTISRHLARLEDVLDRALVDRSRTGVVLTPEGKRLFEQTRESIHLLEPLRSPSARSARSSRSGRVRLQVPRYFARGPMSRVLRDFMVEMPDITIECVSENRLTGPMRDELDAIVTVGSGQEADGEAWPLGPVSARLYGAAALFGPDGPPNGHTELSRYPFLSSCGTAGVPERLRLADDKGRSLTISPKARLVTNELDILLDAARDGLGMVVLPEFVGDNEIAKNRLVGILPDFWADHFMVTITLINPRGNPAARSLVDFTLRRFRENGFRLPV